MDMLLHYGTLHSRVKAILCAHEEGPFPDEPLQEQLVGGSLMEVEAIRGAVRNLMGSTGAGFALDILLCIVSEAQRVKLARQPDGLDPDSFFFDDYADNEIIYHYIHAWQRTLLK